MSFLAFFLLFLFVLLESESDDDEEDELEEGGVGGPGAIETPGRTGFAKGRAAPAEPTLLRPVPPARAAPDALLV